MLLHGNECDKYTVLGKSEKLMKKKNLIYNDNFDSSLKNKYLPMCQPPSCCIGVHERFVFKLFVKIYS